MKLDHARIAHALCMLGARWESWGADGRGEFCIGGIRYATRLDDLGVPVMTDGMKDAIKRAIVAKDHPS